MKKTAHFLWLVGLACQLNAADMLSPSKIIADMSSSLVTAYSIALKESSNVSKSPASKLFSLKDFFLPFIGPMIGIDPSEFSVGSSDTTSNTREPMVALLENKTLLALFASENIIERSATHLKYAVRINFCQALKEHAQASEHTYSVCERVVGKDKLFITIKDEIGHITISVLWEHDVVAILSITPTSLSNTILLGNLFLLIKDIKPDTSLTNLAGSVGFDFQFSSSPTQMVSCAHNARHCIAFQSQGMDIELNSGIKVALNGANDKGTFMTVEAYETLPTKLFVTVDSFKFDMPVLAISSAINKVMATITLDAEKALFENVSKGPGFIDLFNYHITFDINEGRSIPAFTATHDSLILPASSCCLTVTNLNESLTEKLNATITSPTAKLLFPEAKATSDAPCSCDKPLSAFHTGSAENKDSYFILEKLLNGCITKDQNNASFGVADGTINFDYGYGSTGNTDQPTWLGNIKFMMSALDYLKKASCDQAKQ